MDEEKESELSEEEQDSLRQLFPHCITITWEEDDECTPIVNLDDTPPLLALTMFQMICQALSARVIPPTISYGGEVIFEPIGFFDEDDE